MFKLLVLAFSLLPALALAQMTTKDVEYKDGDTILEGFVAYNTPAAGTKIPGVLVFPDWMGVSDHYKEIAEKLANMGYVAFVADVYGRGVRPKNADEAAKEAGKYKGDRKLFKERVTAALKQLKTHVFVDPKKIAAIGYCFGGTGVIELARSGADIAGVVSVHGGLDSPNPEEGKAIKAKILAIHGADDPFVPQKDVNAFIEEIKTGKVDWQLLILGNNVHGFTNPAAGSDKSKGVAYDVKADKRSWNAMKDFLDEIFKSQ